VTATITFYPKQTYTGDDEEQTGYCSFQDDKDNNFCDKTICTATFDAVGTDEDDYRRGYYSFRYAAAGVAVLCAGSAVAALFVARKRRIITCCGCDEANDLAEQVGDDDDDVTAKFEEMG